MEKIAFVCIGLKKKFFFITLQATVADVQWPIQDDIIVAKLSLPAH